MIDNFKARTLLGMGFQSLETSVLGWILPNVDSQYLDSPSRGTSIYSLVLAAVAIDTHLFLLQCLHLLDMNKMLY